MNTPSAVSHAVALLREERARIDRALSALGHNGTTAPVAPRAQTGSATFALPPRTFGGLQSKIMRALGNGGEWNASVLQRKLGCSSPGLHWALARLIEARQIHRVGRGRYTLRTASNTNT